jgi:DNA-binding transcriptional LysR family regulator
VEHLFDDPLVVAAGPQSHWARRRSIDLAELAEEPWILTPPDTWNYISLASAFRARKLEMPKVRLFAFSLHLINHFVGNGPFLTIHPQSVARFCSLKPLPIEMPSKPWLVTLVTLKNRTLSPVVERFIACAREVSKELTKDQAAGSRTKARRSGNSRAK